MLEGSVNAKGAACEQTTVSMIKQSRLLYWYFSKNPMRVSEINFP
jgi:hypothetical protein